MEDQTLDPYFATLISHRTVSTDIAANAASLDYLEEFFASRKLHVKRFSFNGYGSLVATTREDNKTPRVMLAAHLDVVPAPPELFTLRKENGRYLGRGVFDMKFAIASYMHVIDHLQDNLDAYDIGIMITTEEETGGMDGVKRLVEMGYKPDVCILPDGANDWQIETLAKGFLHVDVVAHGKTAHGSMPWDGDSATYKLVDLLAELKTYFKDQTLATNTLNIGLLEAGEARNQVPASAKASLDIRFVSMADRLHITTTLDTLCSKYGATYHEELSGHPCINELDHPLIAPFAESIHTVTGLDVSGTISNGASDARFYAEVGIPCIIARPSGGGQHADHEWLDEQGYEQYHDVLVDYLNKIARA